MCGHLLEGEADDAGSVEAYAKLKEQERLVGCLVHEVVVAFGLTVPVTVLYEGIVTTEIHADGLSVWRVRNQFRRYAAVMNGRQRSFHPSLIII